MYNITMKRPDVSLRNKIANPMANPLAVEKMRVSLTGKKQSSETKLKRSLKLKQYYKHNPEAKAKLTKNVWDKYTSKIAGTGWRKIRLVALDRDNHQCCRCGGNNRLVVHHKDWQGKRRGVPTSEWNNDLSNLETLCTKCHNSEHRHKAKDYKIRSDKIAP